MYHYYRWNFSAVFIFSTGHPYTAPLSTYTVTNADGTTSTSFNVSAKMPSVSLIITGLTFQQLMICSK